MYEPNCDIIVPNIFKKPLNYVLITVNNLNSNIFEQIISKECLYMPTEKKLKCSHGLDYYIFVFPIYDCHQRLRFVSP